MNKRWILILGVLIIAILGFFFLRNKSTSQSSTSQTAIGNQEEVVIKGSDTEVQMVSNLAENFSKKNPEVKISVAGGGSGVGIASLINGEVDIANSSRKMKDEEIKQAQDKGLDVQEFILAIDGLAVIVHPSNSLTKLTVEDISNIFKGKITNWSEVGGKDEKITLYGRQSTSGTYTFFRDSIVKDDYSKDMRNMEGSQAIVDAVKTDSTGIGYVGVGYVKDESGNPKADIKILLVSKDKNSKDISPLEKEAVQKGDYPISRLIYQYLTSIPKRDSGVEKFLRFESSAEGQETIEKAGFYSLAEQEISRNETLFQKIK